MTDGKKNVLSVYRENGAFRFAMQAFPVIGGAIDLALTWDLDEIERRQSEEFKKEVVNRLGELQEDKVDTDFLRSEEFADLLSNLNRVLKRVSSRGKVKALSAILTSRLTGNITTTQAEEAAKILEDITELDFTILVLAYRSTLSDEIMSLGESSYAYSFAQKNKHSFSIGDRKIYIDDGVLHANLDEYSYVETNVDILKATTVERVNINLSCNRLMGLGLIYDLRDSVAGCPPRYAFNLTEEAEWFLSWVAQSAAEE